MLEQLDALVAVRIAGMEAKRNWVIVSLAICLPIAAYLFYSFYLVMHGGLSEVQKHLRAMTVGDLTTSPRPWGPTRRPS